MSKGKTKETYIKFKSNQIAFGFHYYKKKEESGMLSCYVPAYDIFYSAMNEEEAEKRARVMVSAFFKHYLNEVGWKKFILKIHKLGFRAPKHDFVMSGLLNSRPMSTKLNYSRNAESKFDGDVTESMVESKVAA